MLYSLRLYGPVHTFSGGPVHGKWIQIYKSQLKFGHHYSSNNWLLRDVTCSASAIQFPPPTPIIPK